MAIDTYTRASGLSGCAGWIFGTAEVTRFTLANIVFQGFQLLHNQPLLKSLLLTCARIHFPKAVTRPVCLFIADDTLIDAGQNSPLAVTIIPLFESFHLRKIICRYTCVTRIHFRRLHPTQMVDLVLPHSPLFHNHPRLEWL